jgi:hypothetical protein
MSLPLPPVRLGNTPCGRGVFALRSFEDQEIVGEIRGQLVHDPVYESDYCLDLGPSLSLEPAAPFCYVNHSCEPNCDWIINRRTEEDQDVPGPVVLLRAIRPIEPDAELTIDYAWPATTAIPCLCRSAVCRGWIVAEEELADIPAAGV